MRISRIGGIKGGIYLFGESNRRAIFGGRGKGAERLPKVLGG